MKLLTKILLLNMFLLIGCQSNESKSNAKPMKEDGLNEKAITKLYDVVRKAKDHEVIKLNGNEIDTGKIKIKVNTGVEFDNKKDDKWIFATRFETVIFGKEQTKVTIGSIGIGADREDAIETSINEWIALFGTSLSQIFSKSDMTIETENFEIFPGFAGIRGQAPTEVSGSEKKGQKRIIETLLPILKKSSKNLTSINLVLTVSNTGVVDGECKINNEISQEALDRIKKLEWKGSETG